MSTTARRLGAEFLGTALLLFVIVGSGIAVQDLSTDGATRLFAHAAAVGAALAALIALTAPLSGAHLNPAVTLGFWLSRSMRPRTALSYGGTQLAGAVVGVALANLTFGETVIEVSATERGGWGRPLAELIATFALVLLILVLVRTGREAAVAPAAGAWVAAIVVATVSSGFANPAVTIARTITDTFAGIAPASTPAFVAAQFAGGALAAGAAAALVSAREDTVERSGAR